MTTDEMTSYPEIMKFCLWYEKETNEKGLQYLKIRFPNYDTPEIVHWDTAEAPILHGFELLFERAILLTPGIIAGIKRQASSPSCMRTKGGDMLEKVCHAWNHMNTISTPVARHDVI